MACTHAGHPKKQETWSRAIGYVEQTGMRAAFPKFVLEPASRLFSDAIVKAVLVLVQLSDGYRVDALMTCSPDQATFM